MLDVNGNEKYCFIPGAAYGFLSNFAARFFGSLAYTSINSLPKEERSNFEIQEDNVVCMETYIESKEVTTSSNTKNHEKVDNFEMVSNCSMHHFVDHAGKASISNQVRSLISI